MNDADAIAVDTPTPSMAQPLRRTDTTSSRRWPGEHEHRQRDEREERPAGDLRAEPDVHLALQHAGGRPGQRGQRHEQLPAPVLRSRHAVDRN